MRCLKVTIGKTMSTSTPLVWSSSCNANHGSNMVVVHRIPSLTLCYSLLMIIHSPSISPDNQNSQKKNWSLKEAWSVWGLSHTTCDLTESSKVLEETCQRIRSPARAHLTISWEDSSVCTMLKCRGPIFTGISPIFWTTKSGSQEAKDLFQDCSEITSLGRIWDQTSVWKTCLPMPVENKEMLGLLTLACRDLIRWTYVLNLSAFYHMCLMVMAGIHRQACWENRCLYSLLCLASLIQKCSHLEPNPKKRSMNKV